MDKFRIVGGHPLRGTVCAAGAKNAAVAVIPAALLSDEISVIDNLPLIQDVFVLRDILVAMGAKIELEGNRMTIDPSGVTSSDVPEEMAQRMRASYYLMGVMLGRFKRARVPFPGGCNIGMRPMDQHVKGFRAMGAEVDIDHGCFDAVARELVGSEVYLDVASVGATINIMMCAVKAKGNTMIVNAAKEPHVVDTANFLNAMGASIKGAGTDVIRIKGVEKLHGCNYTIIPDQIEVGTLMIAAAATRGDVTIRGAISTHMEALSAKLIEMGVQVEEGEDYIRVTAQGRPKAVNIKTLPYPGFPTDLQQPITVLLSTARGTSVITENIFESRYKHIDEIRRMGALVRIEDRVAIVEGVEELTGARVTASDLRAGAALIVAGLLANGVTEIRNIKYIERGYEQIDKKLVGLGADICRVPDED